MFFTIISVILKVWFISLPFVIVGLFVFFAYANQKGILEELDKTNKDADIALSTIFWPFYLSYFVSKFILWDMPNKIFAAMLKDKTSQKPQVIKLTGAELDALLTKVREEERSLINKK